MRRAGTPLHGTPLRALLVVLGARACASARHSHSEADLDERRRSPLVRRGKGGRRRQVGMDEWAWEQLQPWSDVRLEVPRALGR